MNKSVFQTGLEGLLKAMDITGLDVSTVREGMAFRFFDRGDRFDMIEYFGGEKKCYTMKYDEECDYVRAGTQLYALKQINAVTAIKDSAVRSYAVNKINLKFCLHYIPP